jgi:hypothetical protein
VITESSTVAQARAWLTVESQKGGAVCPCCTQFVKVYRRVLNAGMAHALVVMYRAHGLAWQQKTETLRGVGAAARDESLLRFWGLLEEDLRLREDGGRAGWWRVTEEGREFVLGRSAVPRHAVVFDSRCLRLDDSEGRITVREALAKKFNWAELMATLPGYDPTLVIGGDE